MSCTLTPPLRLKSAAQQIPGVQAEPPAGRPVVQEVPVTTVHVVPLQQAITGAGQSVVVQVPPAAPARSPSARHWFSGTTTH